MVSSTQPTSLGYRVPHLAIHAARSWRASSDRTPIAEPAQFLQAVVVGLARQMVEGVTEEVDVAALEGGFGKHLPDGCAKACVIVGDDELDAVEAAPAQSEQEVLPG